MIISKPYITKNNDKVRINIDIESNNPIKTVWYECDSKYEKYICTEKNDGFIVTLLLYAMKNNENIISKQVISEKLYYQLTNFLIPTVSKEICEYKSIKIYADLSNEILPTDGLIGTGISCGVDSFYTILSNKDSKTVNFNVDSLTCFNVGGNGSYGGENARKLFEQRKERGYKFAKEYNYNFLQVDSNISEFLNMLNIETHSFRQMAIPLIFQKMYKIYYYSSGYPFNDFSIDKNDTAHFDLLNVHCFSNENTTFYSTGGEFSRLEKIKEIANYKQTYNYLNVCTNSSENCSKCEKCIRTMLALYAIDKLELYKEVFDIEDFYKHFKKRCSDLILYRDDFYHKEIIKEFKNNNKKIPLTSFVLGYIRIIKKKIFIVKKQILEVIRYK